MAAPLAQPPLPLAPQGQRLDARGVCVPREGVYVAQQLRWDCGLACAEMALKHLGLWRAEHFTEHTLRDLVCSPANSVWTIDLLLALHSLGARRLALHTLVAGVDPAHAALPYYAGSLGEGGGDAAGSEAAAAAAGSGGGEHARITSAFARAGELGLRVCAPSPLSPAHIAERLQRGSHIYLALVDIRLMRCEACGAEHSNSELAALPHDGYWGHYVLLYGCDGATGRVSYLDPSPRASPLGCAIGSAALHAARCAVGTDQDIVELEVP
jgi:hypothetical protein